jgi:FAD synthase
LESDEDKSKIEKMIKTAKEQGVKKTMMMFVAVPLEFLRNHSIPMSSMPIKDGSKWNQNRAAIIAVFYVFACLTLSG